MSIRSVMNDYSAVLLDLKRGSGVPAREFGFAGRGVPAEYFDKASTGRESMKPEDATKNMSAIREEPESEVNAYPSVLISFDH